MDKLSFLIRREADISTRYGQLDRLYDIADRVEALEAIAKRYEDAPVLTVERVTAAGLRWNGVDVTDYADYGQRVRLVVEGGE